MKFTKIVVTDWNGVTGEFDITHLVKRENGMYSVIFKNSTGDSEKCLVNEQFLHQS